MSTACFTDNELFVGEAQGERVELKRFNVQDGVGIHLLRFAVDSGGDPERPPVRRHHPPGP